MIYIAGPFFTDEERAFLKIVIESVKEIFPNEELFIPMEHFIPNRENLSNNEWAEANKALVLAGLTPLERATVEKETKIGIAEALSKTKWPTIVMSGGSGQNSAMDVIALKQMTDLVDKMSK